MSDSTAMPTDLEAILNDPGIVVRQDALVFDLIARWAKAPTPTASETPNVTYDSGLLEQLAKHTQAARATTGAGC